MSAETERSIVDKVLSSKAGREISPQVVMSAVQWALQRHPAKDAEKAAKARLHQFYGSWVPEGWAKHAEKILSDMERGSLNTQDAATRLLSLHSSTRERLDHIGECYEAIFASCGPPASALDIACGMNPLSFSLIGKGNIRLFAVDAGKAVVEALDRFFALAGMANARAAAGDALATLPEGRFDLALVMKFLPLAERMEKGGALKLMNSIHASHIAVSFPTRSLSGRNVGMEKNYSEWFEELAFQGEIISRFMCGDEIFYIVNCKDR